MELHELRVAALKQASADCSQSTSGGLSFGMPTHPPADTIIARATAYMQFLDGTTPATPKRKKARR